MKVVLVIHSLSAGGAERVLCFLANAWVNRGVQVTIVTLVSESSSFYDLDSRVGRVALAEAGESGGLGGAVAAVIHRCRTLRRRLREIGPDVVVAFTDTVNALAVVASLGLPYRVVIAERTVPGYAVTRRFWALMRQLTYPRADVLVVQTEGVRRWASAFVDARRIVKIANAVELPAIPANESLISMPGPGVVAIGRLVKLKGFDRLLRAFAACSPRPQRWSLCIIGEGPERASLEQLAKSLGIADRVHLPGRVIQPSRYLPQFDLAVLTSEYEGFPNVIGEAMAAGLPVVSFDCPYGPREIIRDGVDGVLVKPGDESGLCAALERLMRDDGVRRDMGNRAREVTSRFSVAEVLAAWARVIGIEESAIPG